MDGITVYMVSEVKDSHKGKRLAEQWETPNTAVISHFLRMAPTE